MVSESQIRATAITYTEILSLRGRKSHTFEPGRCVESIVCEVMPCESRVGVQLNGRVLDQAKWASTYVCAGDEMIIAPGVGEPTITVAIITSVVTSLLSMALQPNIRVPDAEQGERRFGFTQTSRDAIAGRPVQLCFGTRTREGGRVVGSVPMEGPDSNSRLRLLICLGHGELASIGNQTADFDDLSPGLGGFEGLEINDQPASNFDGVLVSGRMGSASQAVMPGFKDTETIQFLGQQLLNTDVAERTGTPPSAEVISHTTAGGVNSLRLRIRFPGGLYVAGNRPGLRTVKARSRTRLVGGAWSAWSVHVFVEKTQSPFTAAVRLDGFVVSDGAIEVQVERVSIDDGSLATVDGMELDSIVEVVFSNNTYAYSEGGGGYAMLGIELTANDQLSSQPIISVGVGGIKTRLRKTGSAWDDPDPWKASNGFSAMPAAQALLIAENAKWGMSHTIGFARVDLESLWEFWDYCEQEVETFVGSGVVRTRFECHATIDEAIDGWDLLRAVCRVGRATPVVVGGVLRFVLDQVQPSPVEVFTAGSIVAPDESGAGGPQWSRQDSTGGFVRSNQAVGLFEFAAERGEQEELHFPDFGDKWLGDPLNENPNPKQTELFGVTNQYQAMADLVFEMNKLRNIQSTVVFETTRPVVLVRPKERFDVALPQFGFVQQAGRLRPGSTVSTLLLDEPMDITIGGPYEIVVLSSDGTMQTRTILTAVLDSGRTRLTISADLPSAPDSYAEYWIVAQGTSRRPFICESVELVDASRSLWRVTGSEYVAGVYNDTPENDVVRPTYPGRIGPGSIPGLVLDLRADLSQVEPPKARLAWSQTPQDAAMTARFTIYRRVLGETRFEAEPIQVVTTNAILIDLEPGVIEEFAVVAVSPENKQISPNAATTVVSPLTVGGEGVVTPDFGGDLASPTGLVVVPAPDGTLLTSWDQVAGAADYRLELGEPGDDPLANGTNAKSMYIQTVPDAPLPAALIRLAVGRTRTIVVRSVTPEGRVSRNSVSSDQTGSMPTGEKYKQVFTADMNMGYPAPLPWLEPPDGVLENLKINGSNQLEAIDPAQRCRWESASRPTQNTSAKILRARWEMGVALSSAGGSVRAVPMRSPDPESFVWRLSSAAGCPTVLSMYPEPETLLSLRVFISVKIGGVWSVWVDVTSPDEYLGIFDEFKYRVIWQRSRIPYQLMMTHFWWTITETI